jgi:predicted transposase YdaD
MTNLSEADLPGVIQRMRERINAEPQPRADKLWTTAYFLMGTRYKPELVDHLLEGVYNVIESTTYQKVLNDGRQEGLLMGRQEGRLEEGRQILLRQGTKKFGKPDVATVAALEAIHDVDRLEALGLRILDADVHDWTDLLRG